MPAFVVMGTLAGCLPSMDATFFCRSASDCPGGLVCNLDRAVCEAADTPADTADADVLDVPSPPPDVPDAKDPDGPDASARCPLPGTLLVTEVMVRPSASPGGQYIEIFNPLQAPVDVAGWSIRATRAPGAVVLPQGTAPIPALGHLVVAASAQTSANGGFAPGLADPALVFDATSDTVTVLCEQTAITSVTWDASTGWPHKAGAAMMLDPSGFTLARQADPRYWCAAFDAYGKGDLGTPGITNPPCGDHSCGDGFKQAWEQCDDGNAKNGDGCDAGCVRTPTAG